ncbi:MAG TPA: hypothetical protein VIJ85_11220 [Rhizomicrobium sp.]
MRKSAIVLLTVGLFASGCWAVAQAASGGHSSGGHSSAGHSGGGHFSGGHSGGGHGGHHGGGAFYSGIGIGAGLGALYYGSPYWNGYGAYDYPDYDDSDAPPPDAYPTGDEPPVASNGPGAIPYWYHCDKPEGFYPYVKTCDHWQPVPAMPPPPPSAPGDRAPAQ